MAPHACGARAGQLCGLLRRLWRGGLLLLYSALGFFLVGAGEPRGLAGGRGVVGDPLRGVAGAEPTARGSYML